MTAFHVLSNDALTTVVGVSDHAEIEGTTHELYRAFRGNPRGAQLEQLRDLALPERFRSNYPFPISGVDGPRRSRVVRATHGRRVGPRVVRRPQAAIERRRRNSPGQSQYARVLLRAVARAPEWANGSRPHGTCCRPSSDQSESPPAADAAYSNP